MWLALCGRYLLLEYGWQIVSTLLVGLVMLIATVAWALSMIAQPGGIYWLASTAPPEIQAQHPLVPPELIVPTIDLNPPATPVKDSQPSDRAQFMLTKARAWLGVPYLWGGCTTRGVDCSCFIQNALAVIGIQAPRTTTFQQIWARPVGRSDLHPGDLVFFDNTCQGCGANPTHVGMYLGNGQMIDAGSPVQIESIDTPYWRAHFDSAGRPPGL